MELLRLPHGFGGPTAALSAQREHFLSLHKHACMEDLVFLNAPKSIGHTVLDPGGTFILKISFLMHSCIAHASSPGQKCI